MKAIGREILEHDFGGDLQAYAEDHVGPKPPGVDQDPTHPWHLRVEQAKATVDLPDDCLLPPDIYTPYTRQEVCQLFGVSDSALQKWKVKPRGKSGKWALYCLGDVLYQQLAMEYFRAYRKGSGGKSPPETLEQRAAMIRTERQYEFGTPKYWRPGSPVPVESGGQGRLL
jgi:hypothetical protein